jgi:hypothetical protein
MSIPSKQASAAPAGQATNTSSREESAAAGKAAGNARLSILSHN